jgi:hypothetical protein
MPDYNFVVHDFLCVFYDSFLVGCVFDVGEGDAGYFCEVVGYFFIGVHVAVEEALSALADDGDAGEELLVSAFYELAVYGDALGFLFGVWLFGGLLEEGGPVACTGGVGALGFWFGFGFWGRLCGLGGWD